MTTTSPVSALPALVLFSAVAVVLVALKLCKVIAWSWWIVTAPWWIPIIMMIGACLLALIPSKEERAARRLSKKFELK